MKKLYMTIFTFILTVFNCFRVKAANFNLVLDGYPKFNCAGNNVPTIFPQITSTVVTVIQIAVPIIIVITGMIDMSKAVMAQKEDEIKKGKQTFINRLILGILVFVIFAIVRGILGLVSSDISTWNCVDCFINGCDAIK